MKIKNFIKCTLTFTSLSLLISNNAVAQFTMAVGPKGGVTVTSFAGDIGGTVRARTGGLGGLFISANFGEVFALQPEFLIAQRGGILTNNNTENSIYFTYFDIPVLAKLRLPIDKVFYPHLLLGPDFAFNTNTSVSSRDTKTGTNIVFNGGDFNKTDLGVLAGAGVDFQSKRVMVTADARYGSSFNSLGSNNNTVSINYRNVGWSFTAGVGIRLFVKSE